MGEFRPRQRGLSGGRIPRSLAPRGASVLEVLVGLAVFALVTTLITLAFTLAHRYTRVYHQLSSAERECMAGMGRISEILRQCPAESLQPPGIASDACWAISCLPPESGPQALQFDPTSGRLLYQKWTGIWRQNDGQLVQSELALSGAPAPLVIALSAPTPSGIADFQAAPRHHRLAGSVRRFQVSNPSSNLIRVELETQTTESGNPATRYQLSSSFPAQ